MMMGSSAVFEPVKPRFGVSANEGAADPPRMTPGAQARARDRRRRPDPGKECARDRGGLHHRRHRRPHRSRQPGRGGDSREALRTPRSGAHRRSTSPMPRPAPCTPCARQPTAAFSVTLLDGVTGSGKTAGLLRGRGTHARAGPPGAHHAARDRAHQPVHGPLHRALRLRAGRVAFRALLARARAGLARGGDGRSARRGRRALCAVPALQANSASSSSTRSTTAASSRKTACTTRRATWPWCAPTSASSRSSSRRPRRRSRATSMPAPAATAA